LKGKAMTVAINHLRTETLENPLGIDANHPRLSWRMETARNGAKQSAYQVVGRVGKVLHWDSGRVESCRSTHVPYGGELHSRDRIDWIVRIWDETGTMTESAPAIFEMGLLKPEDWQTQWIGGDLSGGVWTSVPSPYLRKEFLLKTSGAIRKGEKPAVLKARLFITALGVYEASLNGQPIGADLFNPGWTDYNKRIHYHTYDVTSMLKPGANALAVLLGDGWYCGHLEWRGRQRYGDRPRLLAQLEITFADGSTQTIVSDETWKHNYGALLASDILMGEDYDARREFYGWDKPGFDESGWRAVVPFETPKGKLFAASVNPVRATQEINPLSVADVDDWPIHRWVFDLGQNMVGHVRLKVNGKPGQTITLRHAEALVSDPPLSPNGTLYSIALRTAKSIDHYTCKGGGEEVWEPRFTFHGFRYVEVVGVESRPPLDMITGIVVHTDLPMTGSFECSEPLLNRLQQNIHWSQRGNFLSIPTDCPQRDERLGWTGDILAFAQTAAFNMDVSAFLEDWSRELALAQREDGVVPMIAPDLNLMNEEGGPAWADALIGVPWALYQAYGDSSLLAELYPAFKKFIAWLETNSPGNIRAASGWQGFGDWLSTVETPRTLIATAHYAHSVDLMSRIADILGYKDEAANFRVLLEEIRSAFQDRFILPGGLILNNTQTGYALALAFDLFRSEVRAAAAENLFKNIRDNGNKLTTGFVGTPHLLSALSENGHLDTAYALLLQKDYPSWLYPVTQGATTIWERWDGWRHDRGFQSWMMNSFNHYAYGAVGNWMYQVIAGIRPDPEHPGFQRFILNPEIGGNLTYACAEYESLYGKIISDWKIDADELNWKFTIPANTSAAVVVKGISSFYESGQYELRIKI
jgi:alpha-L-rhamnosidase